MSVLAVLPVILLLGSAQAISILGEKKLTLTQCYTVVCTRTISTESRSLNMYYNSIAVIQKIRGDIL